MSGIRPLRTRLTLLAAAAIALALHTEVAHATDLRNVLADYSVSIWTRKDGLPPGTIRALAQGTHGFLWIGGDFGLMRFDGTRFERWDAARVPGMPKLPVQTLHVARDGAVWIGFANPGGIGLLNGNTLTTFATNDGLTSGTVSAIVEDPEAGIVAVCGSSLFRFASGRWERWDVRYAPGGGHVRTASISPSGDLFIVADVGMFRRRRGQSTFTQLENNDAERRVQDVVEDPSGRVWVTDLIRGFRAAGQSPPRTKLPGNGKGFRLLTDQVGNLWVATLGQGLWRVRMAGVPGGQVIERTTDLTGLSNNSASALLEDRDGNIWAGTNEGLNRLTPHKVTEVTDLGLATGVDVTPDGRVWVGTANGVMRLAESAGSWKRDAWVLQGLATRAMHIDAHGSIWVATDAGMRRVVSGDPARLERPAIDDLRRVTAITSNPRGELWMYDLDRGLVRWVSGRVDTVDLPADLRGERVSTMYTDRAGRVWLGFARGQIAIVDPDGTMRAYGPSDGLLTGICHAIYEDETGTVWVGGSLGLGRFTKGRFVTLRELNGAPINVTSVIGDDAGMVWFGNLSGIIRLNVAEFDRALLGRASPSTYHSLDASDGVAGTTDWNGQRSAVHTNGRLWFLTEQGLTIVDPRVLTARHAPEPVQIDQVRADDREFTPVQRDRLPSGTTRIEIDYTLPDLTSTLKTRFRYRLDGFDKDWIDAGTSRQAVYSNLPRRPYVFRVEANNEDGLWARPSATWEFGIQPRFYETRTFYASLVGLCIATICLLWQRRMASMRRQFAILLGERVRLSREIHDTLLQSMVGVTLQLDHLSHEVEMPRPAREQFVRMRRQVEDYIREARQSIWNLRSSTLQRHDLVTALRQAGEHAREHDLDFNLRVVGAPHRYYPLVEEQILRIGQEALANAIKHSEANRVDMELRYDRDQLTLRVTDDGIGFDPSNVAVDNAGHCGVSSMRERAETVGGVLRISSVAGAGALVEATVPAAAATSPAAR